MKESRSHEETIEHGTGRKAEPFLYGRRLAVPVQRRPFPLFNGFGRADLYICGASENLFYKRTEVVSYEEETRHSTGPKVKPPLSGRPALVVMGAGTVLMALILALVVAYSQVADPGFGDRIETNRTLGGSSLQTAVTPAKTLVKALDYFGNVICPLAAGLFVILTIVAFYHGRSAGRYAVVAVLLLLVAGLTRVIETFVIRAGTAP